MKYLAPALAAALFAAPSVAQDASAETTVQVADESQNRMVCKRIKETGSRVKSKRTCMTAAQWEQLERDQREATERAQSQRTKSD